MMKVCPKCGENNPPEAGMCWACHSSLSQTELSEANTREDLSEVSSPFTTLNKICPKCREENPHNATLCWSCYTPLSGINPSPIRINDEIPEFRYPQMRWWKGKAEAITLNFIFFGLVSSGWWRGKTRFWVLGGLTSFIAGVSAYQKWEGIRVQRELKARDPRDLQSPVVRIADAILIYGVKEGASQIRLTLFSGAMKVDYKIKGQWHEQMKIPHEVWRSLRNEFEIRAASGAVEAIQGEKVIRFQLRLLVEAPHQELTLTRHEAE